MKHEVKIQRDRYQNRKAPKKGDRSTLYQLNFRPFFFKETLGEVYTLE